MKIFQDIFKKMGYVPSQPQTKSYAGSSQTILIQGSDFIGQALRYGGYNRLSRTDAMDFYRKSSALSTAVDIISQEVARIQPVVENPDGSLTDDSPILDLLRNPNEWGEDLSYFLKSIAASKLITGDFYVYGGGLVSRAPVVLYCVKPQLINEDEGANDGRVSTFYVFEGDGQGTYRRERAKSGVRYYSGGMKELWHARGYSSRSDNIRGDSPIESILLDVQSHISGRLHNKSLLDNGARPSALVNFKDTQSQDQLRERRQALNEQLGGAENAGKIVVVGSNDMVLTEMSISNKDMDYAELERITEQCIYKRYRIPLPLISTDASTFSNMSSAVYQLYDFAVLPCADDIFSNLTMFLMPRFGLKPEEHKITYDPEAIPAIRSRMIQELKERKSIGIESINELREGLPNREPVEGGDDILVSATMIPIASVKEQEEMPSVEDEAKRLIARDS